MNPLGRFRLFSFLMLVLLLQACASVAPVNRLYLKVDPNNQVQVALFEQLQSWQGTPYRLGGYSKEGIDCSGFVQRTLLEQFSINIPRNTARQVQIGNDVSPGNIQIGDLVFFQIGQSQRHVGIYIGQRKFLHASTRVGVTLNSLDEAYWQKTFWKVKRVLPY